MIGEDLVAGVVAAISEQMKDRDYTQLAVGHFVQSQPHVSRFISAQANVLGSGEAVVEAVFHLEVIRQCLEKAHGKAAAIVEFADLDAVHGDDPLTELATVQSAFADYVVSNIENEPIKNLVAHVAIAMDARYR